MTVLFTNTASGLLAAKMPQQNASRTWQSLIIPLALKNAHGMALRICIRRTLAERRSAGQSVGWPACIRVPHEAWELRHRSGRIFSITWAVNGISIPMRS